MAFSFDFLLSAPITREEIDAWHEREGITEADRVPFQLAETGAYISCRTNPTTSGASIATYLPRLRDWLATRDIKMTFQRGDFVPQGFWRPNGWDEPY